MAQSPLVDLSLPPAPTCSPVSLPQAPSPRNTSSSSTRGNSKPSKVGREYHVENNLPPLGTGDYGTVFRGYEKHSRDRVAIKLTLKQNCKRSTVERVRNEGAMLKKVGSHSNVLPQLDFGEDSAHLYIVTPIIEGMSLACALHRSVRYDEDGARDLLRGLLSAIAHMHAHGVMHRDIKTENVLLRSSAHLAKALTDPVLIDFGFATDETTSRDVCGTPYYLAPEMIATARDKAKTYDSKCDVWSFGVLAYMVLQGGARPFKGRDCKECFRAIELNMPSWDQPLCAPAARAFVESVLVVDPARRPTATEALQHPWLNAEPLSPSSRRVRTAPLATDAAVETVGAVDCDPRSRSSSFSWGARSVNSIIDDAASADGGTPAALPEMPVLDTYPGDGGSGAFATSAELSRLAREMQQSSSTRRV